MSVFFDGIEQRDIAFGAFTGKSPMFFRDLSLMSMVFTADLKRLRPLVANPLVRPLAITPRRGLVAVHAFEYRDSDIGPYNEVSVSVAVTPRRASVGAASAMGSVLRRDYHAFIAALPVTTEIARVGGIEVLGYPKVLSDITFATGDGERRCTWREGADVVLRANGAILPVRRMRQERLGDLKTVLYHSYPVKNGVRMHARMRVNLIESAWSLALPPASVRFGDGPAAAWLRDLNIGRCLQYLYVPRGEAVLLEPEPMSVPAGAEE